jgi:hypothetical protein
MVEAGPLRVTQMRSRRQVTHMFLIVDVDRGIFHGIKATGEMGKTDNETDSSAIASL